MGGMPRRGIASRESIPNHLKLLDWSIVHENVAVHNFHKTPISLPPCTTNLLEFILQV
jgi:hypothetical protein